MGLSQDQRMDIHPGNRRIDCNIIFLSAKLWQKAT
jgi:hypothetical protein